MLENDLSPALKPTTVYLKDYSAPDYLINRVSLDVQLGRETTVVTSTLLITRNGDHALPLVLDGEKLTLLEVALNKVVLQNDEYQLGDETLSLENLPGDFSLTIKTQLQPHLNTELSGLYQSSGNFCTQCEAEGFRRISYFLDRPDVLAEYDVTLTANKQECPVLLSNGNYLNGGDNPDGTHWAHWHDPHPKPSYLFALVAGNLEHITDTFETESGRSVELNIYTQAHNIDKCEHAMASLKHSMGWDEKVYGREYDLSIYNIVAVDDFNMGAMENKGLNVFNSKYVLADQQTATDSDFEGIESVIGHEYFHNWSGNRVTCRDWFQLSLKEGFTVFRDQEFSADMGSRAVKRIRDVQVLRAHQFKEDAGPMAHPIRPDSYQEINNFYTVTIYEKGAEVIRMMQQMVGVEGFRKGTDLYFDTFDGQAVTTEDFVRCIEQANSIDLTQFRLWYTQSGTPKVSVEQSFEDGVLSLSFKQSCPPTPGQETKRPFHIPINIALFDDAGKCHQKNTLILKDVQKTFKFEDLPTQPVVSMLRDFSAPIKLEFDQTDDELALLVGVDDNGFSRWEAMQRLSLNLILPAISTGEICDQRYQQLVTVFTALIDSNLADKAILAEMLSLPSAAYLAELSTPTDPQRIVTVRKSLLSKLAADLESAMLVLFEANSNHAGFSLGASAMATRSLKNTALKYLVITEKVEHYQRAIEQYKLSNNMTDRLAAFTSLVHSQYSGRSELVDGFYEQWYSETLVLDKWFAIQAMNASSESLSNVKKLMQNNAFSMNNPNKVRSLIGAFTSNLQGFHQVDGSGYRFLADCIIQLNDINPQVAARLAGVFNSWRSYASPYSALMRKEIERINKHENLARDVTEIVSKALL